MSTRPIPLTLAMLATMFAVAFLRPAPAAAHCDSMDGPVVTAARRALETREVSGVLIWVLPEDEQRIRDAFQRTLKVRALGGDARELADLWFFETLVRIHRAGEGEPYTGLKPAGTQVPAGIAAADHAIESGSVDRLAAQIGGEAGAALRQRFEHVQELRTYAPDDVAAGRRYVQAYVRYIHFVEQLYELIHGNASAVPRS
ncbi:MAG TPA: DUF6448 family protein [Longimicrobiales bacterium]|nr:DUF6448 family protein [Longimicrobiales bacterium]